ncbi:MAG: hypothetical protein ACQEW0_12045 [Pseudomonadota bacterium]
MLGRTEFHFKYIFDRLFLFSLAIYILNNWLIPGHFKKDIQFFDSYLNDILFPAVAIPIVLFITKICGARKIDIPPQLTEMILPLIIWSIGFEFVGPYYFDRGTADIIDVFAYFTGGIGSWIFWNRVNLFGTTMANKI